LVETQIRLLGVLYIALGSVSGLAALFDLLFFGGPANLAPYFSVNPIVAQVWLAAVLILMVPSIALGFGLLNFRDWARTFGIVLSILEVVNVPLGIVIGIYGLALLFSEGADTVFIRRFSDS
jgi:hypothetical protein